MTKKPNFKFERSEREKAKATKQAEKEKAKSEKKAGASEPAAAIPIEKLGCEQ